MLAVRSLVFNVAFFASTLAFGVLALPMLAAPPAAVRRFGALWSRFVLRLLDALAGTGWEARGTGRIPEGAVVFAAKHQSAWDTLFFPAYFGEPAMVAKWTLRLVPFYGWYAWRAGTVWLDRGKGARSLRAMVSGAREALAAGRHVVVFPQGTRTRPGETAPYLSGIAALYSGSGAPVVPVALNSGLYWGRRAFLKRPGTIIVEFLEPVPQGLARDRFMDELSRRIDAATGRLEAEARGGRPPAAGRPGAAEPGGTAVPAVDNSVDEAPPRPGGTRA